MSEALSVPSDWDEKPIGELGEVKLGRQRAPRFVLGNDPKPYLRVVNISEGKLDLRDVKRMDFIGSDFHVYRLQHGDVLLTEGDLGSAFNVGRTAVYRDEIADCCYTNTLIRFRKFDGEGPSEYYHYVFELLRQFGMFARTTAATTVYHLSSGRLKEVLAPVAPVPEQRKIARILTTLDNLIKKTEALIAKYQKIKQGMMHDLFTRGVDSSGQLRPTQEQAPELYKQSELGWIPKEWEPTIVGAAIRRIESGWSPECIEKTPQVGDWGVLKVSAVTSGEYLDTESKTLPPNLKPRQRIEVQPDDVILTRSNGVAELVGLTVHVETTQAKLMLSDKLLRLVPDSSTIETRFLALSMQSNGIRSQVAQVISGSSGQRNISQPELRAMKFALPKSLDEQRAIASAIYALRAKQKAERTLLEKFRLNKSGLMQDLLTGKVRVTVDEAEEVAAHA